MPQHHRLIILGSGPAGCTAAIYSARAGLNPVIITGPLPGGQLITTTKIDNWPGAHDGLQGPELMDNMLKHVERLNVKIISDQINSVALKQLPFQLDGDENQYTCDALIIATGASPRYLGLASEQIYMGRGVSTCATCDGFFYKNQDVAVIGGGNTAVEEALYLSNIAKHVTVVHRRDKLRAEKLLGKHLMEKAKTNKISIEWNNELNEIVGDDNGVTGIRIKNKLTDEIKEISLQGVFIAIGYQPNSQMFLDQLEMVNGYVTIQEGFNATATSIPGVFAAGDVIDYTYRQAITSAASGCMAALDAERFLEQISL